MVNLKQEYTYQNVLNCLETLDQQFDCSHTDKVEGEYVCSFDAAADSCHTIIWIC
ncbi:MAG: hypothetical protein IPN46_08375 [Saprospiraceae bacterium]|nr:hypothetical protein [Saprospiraceae bacterium]